MKQTMHTVLGLLLGFAVCLTVLGRGSRTFGADPVPKPDWKELLKKRSQDIVQLGLDAQEILDELEKIMRDPDATPEMKLQSIDLYGQIMGLGTTTRKISRRILDPMLKERDPKIRKAAASLLAGLGNPDSVPDLIRQLKDEDADVRFGAAGCLATFKARARFAVPALIEALEDKNPQVVWCVSRTLGEIGSAAHEAIPALIKKAKDDIQNKPERTSGALQALGHIGAVGPEGKQAVHFLRDLVKGEDHDWGAMAAMALGEMVPEVTEAIPDLIQLYEIKDIKERKRLVDVQTAVLAALGSMGPAAAKANPKVCPFLIQILKDSAGDWDVRWSAAHALREMGQEAKTALPLLREIAAREIGKDDDTVGYLRLREAVVDALRWIQE